MTWNNSFLLVKLRPPLLSESSEYQDKMGEEKADAKVDLGLLEEDDEFEEFPADSANKTVEEDKDANVWEDNWDDDNVEDDFANQLR